MKDSILAIRRQDALDRIEYAFEAIGAGRELDLQKPSIAVIANRDPAVKHMLTLEGIADRLTTLARDVAPDHMPTIDATPTALELATEQGVDLAKVEGTGADGRILKSDVLEAVDVQAAEREEATRLQAIADAEANTTAAALKYAHENGVDLTAITGTGTGGRITLEDVKGANGEA